MFCKWCGLESETSNVCNWCRKPFAAPLAAREGPSAPEPSAPPSPQPPNQNVGSPPAMRGQTAGPVALGSFDDLDDDFSPSPFGSPIRPIAPQATPLPPPARPSPPAPTPLPANLTIAPPPAANRTPVSPPLPPSAAQPPVPLARTLPQPPISPGRGGPGYTPPAPRPAVDDRPPLEAIPNTRTGGAGNAPPPPVIPISRPPAAPPAAGPPLPAARPVLPLAGGPSSPVTPIAETPPPPAGAAPAPVRPGPAPLVDPLPDMPAKATPAVDIGDLGLKPLGETDLDDVAPLQVPGRVLDLGGSGPPPQPRVGSAPSAPPPPTRAGVATAPRPSGGRTWYCRWCGLESETADHCSWCRKDLRNLPSGHGKGPAVVAGRHAPPAKKGPTRIPAKPQEQVTQKRDEKPASPNGGTAPPLAPQLGTFTPQKSKYYSDMVMDPISGTHYDADTGTAEPDLAPIQVEEIDDTKQVLINLGVLLLIALVGAAVVSAFPASFIAVLAIANFSAGISMPILRTVPFAEEDFGDGPLAIALIVLLGPFAGGIVYGVKWMIQSGGNPGVAGVFVSSVVLRAVLGIMAGVPLSYILPFRDLTALSMIAQWIPLIAIAGWLAAAPFHKPDE